MLGVAFTDGGLKSSYDDIISAVDDIFLPMGSKHRSTNERSVGTEKRTSLENQFKLKTIQVCELKSLYDGIISAVDFLKKKSVDHNIDYVEK